MNADERRYNQIQFIRVYLRSSAVHIEGRNAMRFAVAVSCLMMLFATGCTRFSGEWLEEGTVKPDGTVIPADGERRQAMRFDWPATIRYGSYADLAGVV